MYDAKLVSILVDNDHDIPMSCKNCNSILGVMSLCTVAISMRLSAGERTCDKPESRQWRSHQMQRTFRKTRAIEVQDILKRGLS